MNAKLLTLLTALATAGPAVAQNPTDHSHAEGEHHDLSAREIISPASVAAYLTHTPEIDAALADGGEPVVADMLGVVCDFCATAMNKIFGKRREVAAVYVDLDSKALSLVLNSGMTLSDEKIGKLARKAGYKVAAVRRGGDALGA